MSCVKMLHEFGQHRLSSCNRFSVIFVQSHVYSCHDALLQHEYSLLSRRAAFELRAFRNPRSREVFFKMNG